MGYGVESSWVFFQMLRHGPGAGVNVIASSRQDFFVTESVMFAVSSCTFSRLSCFCPADVSTFNEADKGVV